jgi:CSLREA domain-containing protein
MAFFDRAGAWCRVGNSAAFPTISVGPIRQALRPSAALLIAGLTGATLMVALLWAPRATRAENIITVNTLNDDNKPGAGVCSLREAINNFNAFGDTTGGNCAPGTGVDTIAFSVTGTIKLALGPLTITGTLLVIDGGETITLDGLFSNQIFVVESVLEANGLTLQNASGTNGGAASVSGTLLVTNCVFQFNKATGQGGAIYGTNSNVHLQAKGSTFNTNSANGGGGAIYNPGALNVSGSTFTGNSNGIAGNGGAIDNIDPGALGIDTSYFLNNTAHNGGGAIYNSSVTNAVNVFTSTFSNNSALGDGGAIGNSGTGGTTGITNSTFVGNSALEGGATFNSGGIVEVHFCTFSGNSATGSGGGAIFDASSLPNGTAVGESVLVTGGSGGNCNGVAGRILDSGYNISTDTTCGFAGTGADGQSLGDGVVPRLDPNGLQNNGGPTVTIAEQSGSPSIDAVPDFVCGNIPSAADQDQRGDPRADPEDSPITHHPCDIGAFELQESPASPTPTAAVTPTETPLAGGTATSTAVLTPSVSPKSCVGDCDGNGMVAVNELITLVNIDLGNADVSACPNGIPPGATVDIALIIRAVDNALIGCSA